MSKEFHGGLDITLLFGKIRCRCCKAIMAGFKERKGQMQIDVGTINRHMKIHTVKLVLFLEKD